MRTAFCLIITVSIITCSAPKSDSGKKATKPPANIALAHWLVGSWHSKSSDAITYEIWKPINDSTLSGQSYSINNGDTVSSEIISLVQRNGQLAYIPTVPNQNNGVPIEFRLTFINRDKMIFENPDHDFPQMISYEHLSPDSLIAEISGVINGERRAIQFPMRRSD